MEVQTTSFAWVGPTTVLLAVPGSTADELGHSLPHLDLVDLSDLERGPRRWKFHLPRMLSKRSSFASETFCFSLDAELPPFRRPTSDPPFYSTEGDSLIVLIGYNDCFRMFCLLSRLFEVAQRMACLAGVEPKDHIPPLSIPWALWGPAHTHIYHEEYLQRYNLYGTRYVTYLSDTSELVVLDFNRRRAKHKMQECSDKEVKGTTTVCPFDDSYWGTIAEEVGASQEEQCDLLHIECFEPDGWQKPIFTKTVLPFNLSPDAEMPMLSEDAIYVSTVSPVRLHLMFSTLVQYANGEMTWWDSPSWGLSLI